MDYQEIANNDKKISLFWIFLIKRVLGLTLVLVFLSTVEAAILTAIRYEAIHSIFTSLIPDGKNVGLFAWITSLISTVALSFSTILVDLLQREYNNLKNANHVSISWIISVVVSLAIFTYLLKHDTTVIDCSILEGCILGYLSKYLIPLILVSVFALMQWYVCILLSLKLNDKKLSADVDAFLAANTRTMGGEFATAANEMTERLKKILNRK